MPEHVAIVGSREGADLSYLCDVFMPALWAKYPDTVLVSGGANGVDITAESAWLTFGGAVVSLRPAKWGDSWGVERWDLSRSESRITRLIQEPTFMDFKSAALYRDMLIAEMCDRLCAFLRPGGSRGAGFTAEIAGFTYGKPVHRYEGGQDGQSG